MNWPLFLSVYTLIFVAELPDKTAFAILFMASRGHPVKVFTGVALAFLVQTVVAILFGSVISLAPEKWVHLGAGIMFLGFAVHNILKKEEEAHVSPKRMNSIWQPFLVIFIAEWGDLTQIATASLVAKYHEDKITIFAAAVLALWSVTIVAIVVGNHLKKIMHGKTLHNIATTLYFGIGAYFVLSWFRP